MISASDPDVSVHVEALELIADDIKVRTNRFVDAITLGGKSCE